MLTEIGNYKISKYKEFNLSKNTDYSKQSLQRHIFKNVDINESDNISFHRVDFKGSSLNYCNFRKVDFSRSDFVSMNIQNTFFKKSSFESCTFLNNIFENCVFENNKMNSLDLLRTSFFKCRFIDEKFDNCNWTNITFDECEFNNFEIEKSTLQDIKFKNCELENLDLARLTAISLTFENCTLNNIIFDPDNLGSYCFDKKSLGNISYLYKEKIFKFEIDNLNNIKDYSNYLLESQRYAEFFGFSAILSIKGISFLNKMAELWINCLKKSILEIKNEYTLSDNIKLLTESLKFYMSKKLFSISEIIQIMKNIMKIRQKNIPLSIEEGLFYISTYLKEYIEKGRYSYEELEFSKDSKDLVYAKFTLETDCFLEAEKIIHRIYSNILFENEEAYYVIDSKKGSIILTIITTLVSILGISKVLLTLQTVSYNIILNHKKFKNNLLLENKREMIIKNLNLKKEYTLKDLMKTNPKLVEMNKTDLKKISELEIYIDE